MRYFFQKIEAGDFVVYRSQQSLGDQHLKRFEPGVTPHNQSTLNIYVDGRFRVTAGAYSQIFEAGDTSLQSTLAEYPGNVPFTEEVISPSGLRYCVSRAGGGRWSRARVRVASGEAFDTDSVLIVLAGSLGAAGVGDIVRQPAGEPAAGDATVVRCWVEPLVPLT